MLYLYQNVLLFSIPSRALSSHAWTPVQLWAIRLVDTRAAPTPITGPLSIKTAEAPAPAPQQVLPAHLDLPSFGGEFNELNADVPTSWYNAFGHGLQGNCAELQGQIKMFTNGRLFADGSPTIPLAAISSLSAWATLAGPTLAWRKAMWTMELEWWGSKNLVARSIRIFELFVSHISKSIAAQRGCWRWKGIPWASVVLVALSLHY